MIGVIIGVFIGGIVGVTIMCILQMAKERHSDIDLIFNGGQNRIVQTHSGSISVYETTKDGWKELYHTYTDPMNHVELIDFGKLIVAEIIRTEEIANGGDGMSLIIEGMKMPEYRDVFGDERGCVYLLMLNVRKDGTAFMQFTDVDGGFHRVKEVPTPHGRLIDADELLRRPTGILFNKYPKSCVRNAPTIVEAEASE